MSDDAEDPVDPKPEIEENCKPKCVKQLLQYQASDLEMPTSLVIDNNLPITYRVNEGLGPLKTGSTCAVQKACTKRVEDDDTGSKHCTGQYFDYWGCIDKCAATKLFSKLK